MPFSYNGWLVALSICVAVLVSYTALTLVARVATHSRGASRLWICAGALAMGIGIWSMHFIGMLAFTLPIPLSYGVPTTLLSFVVTVVTSGFALALTARGSVGLARLAGGAIVMGAGICAMHYAGMAAIPIVPGVQYDPIWVGASILIAVGASFVALWLFLSLREVDPGKQRLSKIAAAAVMGLAISGMHYTSMAAAHFAAGSICRGGVTLNNGWFAASIGLFALTILTITLITAVFDAHLQSQSYAEAKRYERSVELLQAEILERCELQAKLDRERELLRTMIDLIPVAIYAKDLNGRYIECNETVARAAGRTVREMIGATVFDFLPAERAQRIRADEQAIAQSGSSLIDQEEHAPDAACGTQRVILSSKVPLRDSANRIAGIVGTDRDITDLKENERRAASAERIDSLGRLSAGLAHEINTPVQYVNDSIYFIRESASELFTHVERLQCDDPVKCALPPHLLDLRQDLPKALERVAEGLARITEIVTSMEDFSRPDDQDMGPIDLNRAITSTLVMARGEYRQVADLKLELADLPLVVCHGNQINQVVLNLVVNAIHAITSVVSGTDRRGLITVRSFVDGDDAVITISDTGAGIAEAIRGRIFEPFFTSKNEGQGTGQGLTIARRVIVQDHGGALTFQTELGQGTTFTIRLPTRGVAVAKVQAA